MHAVSINQIADILHFNDSFSEWFTNESLSGISSQDHYERFSPSQASDPP